MTNKKITNLKEAITSYIFESDSGRGVSIKSLEVKFCNEFKTKNLLLSFLDDLTKGERIRKIRRGIYGPTIVADHHQGKESEKNVIEKCQIELEGNKENVKNQSKVVNKFITQFNFIF